MDLGEVLKNTNFIRVDESHPLDWRVNEGNSRYVLVLVSRNEPVPTDSTDGIKTLFWKGSNGFWYHSFFCNDRTYSKMFQLFCNDIIESSRNIDPSKDMQYAADRYRHWMRMFKPERDLLSEHEVEGLLGEIVVLRDVMFDRYGQSASVTSWMNSVKGKQDFIQEDRWYEIKTVLEGRTAVKISSLEQLDRDDEGRLIVVTMRRSNPLSQNVITLNSIYSEMMDAIVDLEANRQFEETMGYAGYIEDPAYDDLCFEVVRIVEYDVGDDFPRLRGSELSSTGIVSGSYDIALDAISEFEVDHGTS